MQLDGVLFFMPIADVLTAIASIVVIINTNKTLDQLIDMSETKMHILKVQLMKHH